MRKASLRENRTSASRAAPFSLTSRTRSMGTVVSTSSWSKPRIGPPRPRRTA